jgi:putative oxidoreductase
MRSLARILLAGIFVQSGVDVLRNPEPRVVKAASIGLSDPELATRANAAAMVLGGTALALGIKPRLVALLLFASLVPTTAAGHRFWEEAAGPARGQQMIHFFKNLSILGGLLAVVSDSGQTGRRARRRATT